MRVCRRRQALLMSLERLHNPQCSARLKRFILRACLCRRQIRLKRRVHLRKAATDDAGKVVCGHGPGRLAAQAQAVAAKPVKRN